MKRPLYLLQAFGSALLLLAATACSQDDTFAPADSDLLPQGDEPMTFLATGLQRPATPATPASRATVDNDWQNVEKIAVLLNGSEAKAYDVTPSEDFKTARLTSGDPFRWTDQMTSATISVWWPYTDSDNDGIPDTTIPPVVVKSDQRSEANYIDSDYIACMDQAVQFGTPAELQFTHRTAHVCINLTSETIDLTSAAVSLSNLDPTNNNPMVIFPHQVSENSYEALLAPQTLPKDLQFVVITTSDSKSYICILDNETVLTAGNSYTFNITVQ